MGSEGPGRFLCTDIHAIREGASDPEPHQVRALWVNSGKIEAWLVVKGITCCLHHIFCPYFPAIVRNDDMSIAFLYIDGSGILIYFAVSVPDQPGQCQKIF